jgi:hypothetical protein
MAGFSAGAFFTGFVFVVNLIMGTGGLAVPRAFYLAGWALGAMVMLSSSFFACVTISWHFDGLLRGHMLAEAFRKRLIAIVPAAPIASARSGAAAEGKGEVDAALGDALVNSAVAIDAPQPDVITEIMAAPHEDLGPQDPVGAADNGAGEHRSHTAGDVTVVATLRDAMALCSGTDFTIEARLENLTAADDAEMLNSADPTADESNFPPTDFTTFVPNMFMEVCDTLTLFAGRQSVYVWNVGLIGYVVCTLWTYTVVISETAALAVPLPGLTDRLQCTTAAIAEGGDCLVAFRIFVTIFSAVLFVLCMRDWKLMALLQKILTTLIYIILAIIVATSVIGITSEYFPGKSAKVSEQHGQLATPEDVSGRSETHYVQQVRAFNFNNFGDLFGISIFAMMCHTGSTFMLRQMPSLELTKPVFRFAMSVIFVVYTITALVVAFYVGEHTESLTTLNWGFYGTRWGAKNDFAKFLGMFVLCFPIFSVTAAYIITLRSCTDALEFILPLAWRKGYCAKFGKEYTPFNVPETFNVWPLQFSLRTGMLLIGFVLSLISPKFNNAISVASLFGFLILFAVPLLIQVGSQRVLQRLGMTFVTPYEDWTSRRPMLIVVGCIGLVSVVYYTLSHLIPQLFGVKVF